MSFTLLLSMAAFALAASLTPGPVNIVALGAGLNHGFQQSLRHVTGASVGFTLLLVLVGMGLQSLFYHYPLAGVILRWAGVAFLLYMAAGLALDQGQTMAATPAPAPSFWQGALMQWLNPKAWIASAAGIGAYTVDGIQVAMFAVIFFTLCYASIACWSAAGNWLGQHLTQPRYLRRLNRLMAALLAGSALALGLM